MDRAIPTIEDEFLVIECQRGNDDAFEELVRRWQPRYRAYAMRVLGSSDQAIEALQDGWMAIVRNIRKLDDPARYPAWSYRILHRRCTDLIRKSARRRGVEERFADRLPRSTNDPGAGSSNHRAVDDDALHDAMHALSPDDRALLMLHYVEGLALGAIADVLEIPKGTVKSRLYHARERMRSALPQQTQNEKEIPT